MRTFVQLVKQEHLAMMSNPNQDLLSRVRYDGTDFEWPNTDDIEEKYLTLVNNEREENKKLDSKAVSDIRDDCVSFKYLRYGSKHIRDHDYPLIITYKGRHLLMKLGLIREIAADNSDWLNLFIVFGAGVLSAVIITLGSLWIFQHTKPTYVVPKPNVTVKVYPSIKQ